MYVRICNVGCTKSDTSPYKCLVMALKSERAACRTRDLPKLIIETYTTYWSFFFLFYLQFTQCGGYCRDSSCRAWNCPTIYEL